MRSASIPSIPRCLLDLLRHVTWKCQFNSNFLIGFRKPLCLLSRWCPPRAVPTIGHISSSWVNGWSSQAGEKHQLWPSQLWLRSAWVCLKPFSMLYLHRGPLRRCLGWEAAPLWQAGGQELQPLWDRGINTAHRWLTPVRESSQPVTLKHKDQ